MEEEEDAADPVPDMDAVGEDPAECVAVSDCFMPDPGSDLDTWVLTFDQGERDGVNAMIATRDGSILAAGDGGLVIKLDPRGTILWQKYFGESARIDSIIECEDGRLAATGAIENAEGTRISLWIVSLGQDGDVIWQKALGGSIWARGMSIIETTSRELVVAGDRSEKAWVVKLDEDGSLLWQKEFGNYEAWSVLEGQRGELFVLAAAMGSIEYSGSRVIKLDSQGSVLWERDWYDDSGGSWTMVRDGEGGMFIVGSYFGSGRQRDISILRMDDAGTILWHRLFGLENDETATAAIGNRDGSLSLVGYSGGYGVANYNLLLLRLDHEGHSIVQREIDIGPHDYGYAVAELPDGSLVVGGSTLRADCDEVDGVIARLGGAGEADADCASVRPLLMQEMQGISTAEVHEPQAADSFESIEDSSLEFLDAGAMLCFLCPTS